MYLGLKKSDLKSILNGGMNMYDYDTLENLEIQLKEVSCLATDTCNDGKMNLSEEGFENIRYIKCLIEQAINYVKVTIRQEHTKYLNMNDSYEE